MRVLFISSGRAGRPGDVVFNQGESLKRFNVDLDYYLIKPKLFGYIISIPKLRKVYKNKNYDIAHAHYSLSGFVASIAGCWPLIVSLMGSDVFMSRLIKHITLFFSRYIWAKTIVKSQGIKDYLKVPEAVIIPNGVNIERFKPIPQKEARSYLRISENNKLAISIAGSKRPEKNLDLASGAVKFVGNKNIIFRHIHDVDNSLIPYYLNAADVLLLSSRWEGSVNVVKEAMACNCPIVTTNVGDTRWVIGDTEGCYFSSLDISDFADKIKLALKFGKRTNGRQRIIELGLDSDTIAKRIKDIYNQYLQEEKIIN